MNRMRNLALAPSMLRLLVLLCGLWIFKKSENKLIYFI